jgi:heme-degrading monooxygenase HmoA
LIQSLSALTGATIDWIFSLQGNAIDPHEARKMILEVAILDVRPGLEAEFQDAFAKASKIISSMHGYIDHQLQRCVEIPSRYLLLVDWETIEDHTEGFRRSAEYQEWKSLLHHYYDPFPAVEHYQKVFG